MNIRSFVLLLGLYPKRVGNFVLSLISQPLTNMSIGLYMHSPVVMI